MTTNQKAILDASFKGDIQQVAGLLGQDSTLAKTRDTGKATEGNTPLSLAACGGHIDIMKLLLEHGANIDSITKDGSPLLLAAWGNHYAAVIFLLDRGADPNAASASGETPLLAAAFKGFTRIGALVIERGAKVNCQTTSGTTDFIGGSPPVCGESPLHFAAAYGHRDFVELLLKNGADKHIKDHTGQTPLHWASRYRSDVWKLLT